MKRLEQQRKELLEKVFIEQIRKQKELEAEQYYQQQNQLLQLQRLHQLKLLQEEHNGGGGRGQPPATSLDMAIAGRAGFPITLSSGEEQEIPTPNATKEDQELDDPNNAGLHVDDRLNVANADGRVLVNVGHPDTDPDIFLAPQIQRMIKPHQVRNVWFTIFVLFQTPPL